MVGGRVSVERAAPFVEHARKYAGLKWALTPCKGKDAFETGWQKTKPDLPELAAGKWRTRGSVGISASYADPLGSRSSTSTETSTRTAPASSYSASRSCHRHRSSAPAAAGYSSIFVTPAD
jgi:hypothetical protein